MEEEDTKTSSSEALSACTSTTSIGVGSGGEGRISIFFLLDSPGDDDDGVDGVTDFSGNAEEDDDDDDGVTDFSGNAEEGAVAVGVAVISGDAEEETSDCDVIGGVDDGGCGASTGVGGKRRFGTAPDGGGSDNGVDLLIFRRVFGPHFPLAETTADVIVVDEEKEDNVVATDADAVTVVVIVVVVIIVFAEEDFATDIGADETTVMVVDAGEVIDVFMAVVVVGDVAADDNAAEDVAADDDAADGVAATIIGVRAVEKSDGCNSSDGLDATKASKSALLSAYSFLRSATSSAVLAAA